MPFRPFPVRRPRTSTADASSACSLSRVLTRPTLAKRQIASLGLLCAGFCVLAQPLHASSNVPDWVKAAASEPLTSLPPSAKAVVLLDEETYTVAPDGRATIHVRRVTKILRPQGRQLSYPFVSYDKDSKITSMHVWSIDPAGHEYTVKDNEMLDLGAPGDAGDLYNDERARAAAPPGRDPGGVVAVEYDKRERPYLAETTWSFQDGLPHQNQSFTLVLPAGYQFHTTWFHHAKVEPTELANNSLRWTVNHESGVDLSEVPLSPDEGAVASRMTIHYSGPGLAVPQEGTWKGIGLWYETLTRDRLNATPEIAAKAAELTAGKTDFYDKAEAIGVYLQKNIRYYTISLGVGGFQPHSAQEIFRGKYGDCKDKATLLSAMLSSVGIHSALLMVDTHRGVIDPDAPSIAGDHMIGAIEIPAGYKSPKLHSVVTAETGKRYLIFDPTWTLTPFGQLEANLQGSYGVLLEGANSQVIQLPVLDPDLNHLERAGTFKVMPDGTLKGSIDEKRFGDLAMTDRDIAKLDAEKQQKYLDHSLEEDFVSFHLSDMKMENADTLSKDLTLTYQLQAEHFASQTGPLLMIRPRVLGSDLMPIDRKQRRIAIDLGETKQAHDSFDIELPEGYTVDELPDPVKVDFGFASYESSTELRGHTLHYARTYRVKEVTLPADKYPELQKLAATIAADEQSHAILKKGN